MFALLADLLDLLLPVSCAGCGAERVALCDNCLAALGGPVLRTPLVTPPCWAAGPYDGVLRELILEYKERRRHELAAPLGRALATVLGSAVLGSAAPRSAVPGGAAPGSAVPGSAAHASAVPGTGVVGARLRGGPPVVLVPIPSTRAASVARGGDHVRRIAVCAASELDRSGVRSVVLPVLRVVRPRRDSVGLDAVARRRNAVGSIGVRQRCGRLPARVVLVDDLVTTGATLTEAARALTAEGVQSVAAVVLAATQRRHPDTSMRSGMTAASYVKIP